MIWDDHQGKCIGELSFRSNVRVRIRCHAHMCHCLLQSHCIMLLSLGAVVLCYCFRFATVLQLHTKEATLQS